MITCNVHGDDTLKLLPTIFLQRVSEEEEEAREGKGAFSQILGCLGVKDAFSQVPQEKLLNMNLRGEEFLVKRNLPGQRAKALTFLQGTSPEFNYKFSAECPCLGRNEKSVLLILCEVLDFHRLFKVH